MNLDNLQSIDEAEVAGKRVLLRVDLNVPMQNGKVSDATRIRRALPTLKMLVERGAKVIVLSHFDRPKGKRNPQMSLAPVVCKLTRLIGQTVQFANDCIGPVAQKAVANLENGGIVVLENLRFHPGEEQNEANFVAALAELGDIYLNDAFSVSHRAHASTEGLAHKLRKYAGPLMMEEINALRTALDKPERPTVAVVGGAKVSSKIPLLTNMVHKVDHLIIGGGMANTFLLAQGVNIGASLAEPEQKETALEIFANAKATGCTIVLPVDCVVAEKLAAGATQREVAIDSVGESEMILDVGPSSVAQMKELLGTCRTLLWNGPLGAFEIEPFGKGTFALAQAAADLSKTGMLATIAGGGDTVSALNIAGVTDDFTYVSTAGGAFLEWLEGRQLPGIVALT